MMAVIGEQFEELGSYICGVVVNVRQKGDKVALWTRDAQLDDVNIRIGILQFFTFKIFLGYILKSKLGLPDSETIRFEAHKESSARTGSTVKPHIVIPPRGDGEDQQKRKPERERTLSQSNQ